MSTDEDTIFLRGVVHDEVDRSIDQRVLRLFIKALRSEHYPQGYDRLRSQDGTFTPLGVLCDLATKVGVCAWDCVDGEYFIAPMDPPATGAFIPQVVREWAGITGTHASQELPLADGDGYLHPIWRLSDLFRLPFSDIADMLEAQYTDIG